MCDEGVRLRRPVGCCVQLPGVCKACVRAAACAAAGLFLAPATTGEALKGGRLVAEVMAREGLRVIPVRGPAAAPAACLP